MQGLFFLQFEGIGLWIQVLGGGGGVVVLAVLFAVVVVLVGVRRFGVPQMEFLHFVKLS